MTIVEAAKMVLNEKSALTINEILKEIVDRNLYSFGAKYPAGALGTELRRHCVGLVAPSYNSAVKYFKIASNDNGKVRFSVIDKFDTSSVITTTLSNISKSDLSLEEKVIVEHENYVNKIKSDLLEKIIKNSPEFFEQLIVDLLIKMGYGYGSESGVVTGGSHDGGIDGIIYEDKLGLDLIYLQAKRYSAANTISRKDIQAFVGAMEQAHKGVFITTSNFSKEAIEYASRQQKRIKLINGKELTKLMLDNFIGVVSENALHIYKTDSDYFDI